MTGECSGARLSVVSDIPTADRERATEPRDGSGCVLCLSLRSTAVSGVRSDPPRCGLSESDTQPRSCATVAPVSVSLLVLGGSAFVGRAAVMGGLHRGWDLTTFNRGHGWQHSDARRLIGDRLDPTSLKALNRGTWDIVVDTWSGPPRAARDSAAILTDNTARYVYISSGSVYTPPPPRGVKESAPTVDASPDAGDGTYPELKRGAEIALTEAFGERALLARAGLILGPHENVGRLTWWLNRMAGGGEVLCPGPRELPLQYIDARDLARFVLDAAIAGHHGPFNVVSRRGHATMRSLLETCHTVAAAPDTDLTWVTPELVTAAGIEPWTDLPIWLPPDHEYAAMHDANVEHAHAAGLRCRPPQETVTDTWKWLSALSEPAPLRGDLEPPGVDPARERKCLSAWHAKAAKDLHRLADG
jgi:2'-hydroxyisoflavone reductase